MISLVLRALCIALSFFACAGCASHVSSGVVLERQWPEQAMLFRHRVLVEIPGVDLPAFDGVLRLESVGCAPEARVVGLGDLGLTLFDITVRQQGHHTAFLHPSLKRVGGIDAQIARCARGVWFAALSPRIETEALPVRETYVGMTLDHAAEENGWRITRQADRPAWRVLFLPMETQPKTIIFISENPEFTVRIQCVSITRER